MAPSQRGRPTARPNQAAFEHALSLVLEINKGTGKTPAKVIQEAEQMQQLYAQKMSKLKQLDNAKP